MIYLITTKSDRHTDRQVSNLYHTLKKINKKYVILKTAYYVNMSKKLKQKRNGQKLEVLKSNKTSRSTLIATKGNVGSIIEYLSE